MFNTKSGEAKEENRRKQINLIFVISCVVIAIAVLPIIFTSGYTYLQADDFSHANGVGVYRDRGANLIELFLASLRYSKKMYLTWQGTYTAMFLQAFLSPLNGFGLAQLRIVMIFNALLFILSFLIFIKVLCGCCNIKNEYFSALFALCCVGVFGFTGWTEVFYWFSGSTSYALPLSLCFLGIAVTLRSRKTSGCIFAALLMFFASGGSLEISGTGCFILLGLCIIKKVMHKAEYKDYIVFGSAVLGALINTAAPGNYIRHDAIDAQGLHVKTAVVITIKEVINTCKELCFNKPFLILLAVAFVAGVCIGKNNKPENKKYLAFIVLWSCITPFVTCFPVALAYCSFPFFNRCLFVETVMIVTAGIITAVVMGWCVSDKLSIFQVRGISFVLIAFMIVMPCIKSSWKISELIPCQMWKHMAQNSYREYYNKVLSTYDLIENDENENIFLYDKPEAVPGFPVLNLKDDMSFWVNTLTAAYFDRQSVQYVSDKVYGQRIRISPDMYENKPVYVSAYVTDQDTQITETLQQLQPLECNTVISLPENRNGRLEVFVYGDQEGRNLIEEIKTNDE